MRNKIIPLLVFALCLMNTNLFSQVAVGIRGGINLPNIDSPISGFGNKGYKTEIGYDFAALVNIPMTETFSIEPRLEFSAESGKRAGMQAFPIPEGMRENPVFQGRDHAYVDITSRLELKYLLVPVFANFGWDFGESFGANESHFRFYVEAGPHFGFLLNSQLKISDTQTGLFTSANGEENLLGEGREIDLKSFQDSNTIDVKDEFHMFNFGISGNVGLGYHFGQNAIFVELGGNYGFMNIQKTGNGSKHPGALTAGLGYSRKL